MGKIPEMVSTPCHSARLMHFPSIQETQSHLRQQPRASSPCGSGMLSRVDPSHDKAMSLMAMNHARALVNSRKSECHPRTFTRCPRFSLLLHELSRARKHLGAPKPPPVRPLRKCGSQQSPSPWYDCGSRLESTSSSIDCGYGSRLPTRTIWRSLLHPHLRGIRGCFVPKTVGQCAPCSARR